MDDPRQTGVNENAARVKRQLIVRGVVAAGLIVALLAALVVFERNETVNEPPATAKTVTQIGPSISSGDESEPQSSPVADAASDASAAQANTIDDNASTSTPAAVPEEDAEPTTPAPVVPAKNPRLAIGKTPHLVIEQSSAKTPPPAAVKSVTEPIKAVPAKPAATPSPVVAFFVQLGVFSNPANAEELHARLTQNGIPSHVESRVQLGPFNTREEALAAQERLRKLGLESGMVVPARK